MYIDWDRNFIMKVKERNLVKNTMILLRNSSLYCDISTATATMLTPERANIFITFTTI